MPTVHETNAVAAKSVPSQDLSHKPWKNIAITEHDDAEFEELQARMVFTWPPDLAAYRRAVEEERGSCEAAEYSDENISPVASYGASPIGPASTEDGSMILTPTQRDHDIQTACVPLTIPHDAFAEPKAAALEKVMGLQRLRLKAPPPLSFNGKKKIKDVINEIGCTLLIDEGERTARDMWVSFSYRYCCVSLILSYKQMLSPLTAAMNVTSKLSAEVLRNTHTFPDELSI
jgi:hypothetical protein